MLFKKKGVVINLQVMEITGGSTHYVVNQEDQEDRIGSAVGVEKRRLSSPDDEEGSQEGGKDGKEREGCRGRLWQGAECRCEIQCLAAGN